MAKNKDFPQEEFSTPMKPPRVYKEIFFRPNNYRRALEIRPWSTTQGIPGLPRVNKSNKQIFIKDYKGISLILGKNKLVGIYKQNIIGGVKEIYRLRGTIKEIEEKLNKKKEQIRERIDSAMYDFVKKYSLFIPLKVPVWIRYEDFIKGEEYINKIPREVIIHDSYFKKVYDNGIEFIQKDKEEPVIHLKNYIKNRAVEEIAPEIAQEIADLRATISSERDIKRLKEITLRLIDCFIKYVEVQKDGRKEIPVNGAEAD